MLELIKLCVGHIILPTLLVLILQEIGMRLIHLLLYLMRVLAYTSLLYESELLATHPWMNGSVTCAQRYPRQLHIGSAIGIIKKAARADQKGHTSI